MEIREQYKDKKIITYDQLENLGFFKEEMDFSKNDTCDCLLNEIKKKEFKEESVWSLFGRNVGSDWQCLQVACAKNIKDEIVEDVRFMFSYRYDDLLGKTDAEKKSKDTKFFKNVYEIPSEKAGESNERRQCSYSKMMIDYSHFKICILDVEKYLGIDGLEMSANQDVNNIIEIAKSGYAEAKLAYETLAIYWNTYNSNIDGKAISKFLENSSKDIEVTSTYR